jgi:streptomycin 6-kinase
MLALPEHFVQIQHELYGDKGVAWLANLPKLIAECEQRWSLTVQPTLPELSYNFVTPAVRADGTPVMLKLGVPNPELITEIEALRLYDGRGICRLLDADAEQGTLLLERLQPGRMLSELDDDEQATAIAAQVMRQLWRPVPADHPFPTTARWAKGLERLRNEFDGGTGPFPAHLVEQAEALYRDLLASSAEPVLLHGDLHHFNILAAERQPWLAIDPKGVVGEPAYEIGALLRNPTDEVVFDHQVQARRVDLLTAELGLDRQRVIGWGIAQAVLSGWWSYEDHGHGWEPMMALAELLSSLGGKRA